MGLSNIRARLEQLYGANGHLTIGARPEHGVRVTIDLPWERGAAAGGQRRGPAMSTATRPLRVLIVDDEPPARDRIREILEQMSDVEIVGEAGDGLVAAGAIQDQKPDLVFLDIRMPELDGFGVLAALPEGTLPLVVFVTAFDSFAVRAFDVHAVDYILKPFESERLSESVARARERLTGGQDREQERRVLELMAELGSRRRPLERVLVKTGARFEFVRTVDVDWIEAAGNYVTLHVGGRAPRYATH